MDTNSAQELLEQTRTFSDTRILNTISQSHNFRKEIVDAAKKIAVERSLISAEEGDKKGASAELIREAQRLLEDEVPVDKVLGLFASRGIDNEVASSAIHSASKIAVVGRKKYEEEKAKKESGFPWWILLVIFFIIRIILRMVKNG